MTISILVPIGVRLPERLAADIASKLTYLSETIITAGLEAGADGMHSVCFEVSGPDADLEGATRTLVEQMSRSYQDIPAEIAWRAPDSPAFGGDALATLEARGDVIRQGSGLYGLGPRMVVLKQLLEEDLDHIARELDAEFHSFPSLLSLDVLAKGGYFSSFPHHLTFASRSRRNLGAIGAMASAGSGLADAVGRAVMPPGHALQPNLCFHCYAMLEGRSLDRDLVISCQGVCFRHEGVRFHGLDRLFEFTMRELVFVGQPGFVLAGRDRLMELTKSLVQAWGLAAQFETANDPFFANAYASRRFFQLATKAKYELLAPLPHEGHLLAIGSFNMHGEFFTRPFDIRLDGARAHTGCVGFGLERWIYAFVAQHGADPEAWPAALRIRFESRLALGSRSRPATGRKPGPAGGTE